MALAISAAPLAVPIQWVYGLRVLNDQTCETLTVGEAADMLGISRSSAYRQLAKPGAKLGPLTPIRIGRRILFGRKQIEAVLAGEVGE